MSQSTHLYNRNEVGAGPSCGCQHDAASDERQPTMSTTPSSSPNLPFLGAVRGGPALLLRLEGLSLLIAACVAYARLGGSWGWFAALFFTPDLSMLGYLFGREAGTVAYNAVHSTLGGICLAVIGGALGSSTMLLGACIWLGHVGFDRALGYGLKYASGFGDTHLGQKARRPGRAWMSRATDSSTSRPL